MSSLKSLGAADCAVFGVLTILGYLIGLYFSLSRRPREGGHTEEGGNATVDVGAFLGDRRLPFCALAVSLVASIVTGLNVVGFIGHFYAHGFHLAWSVGPIPLAMILTSTTLVPLLYDMRVLSVFQYLRLRFDNRVGVTACIVYFLLSQTLGAVSIYSAAVAISTMIALPLLHTSIAIGLVGTIYTALGGLRGVVWADCVQALVMFSSPLIIIRKVLHDSRNISPPLRPLTQLNTTQYILRASLDLTSDENIWSGLFGGLPYALVRTGFDQMAFQRFMAARTMKDAKKIVVASAFAVIIFFVIIDLAALSLIYWYKDCDPLLSGAISSPDQIVPYFLRDSLADVAMLRGLFLAGMLSASTSTVSSIINSHAAVFYVDIVTPFILLNERKARLMMQMLALASGTLMTLFAVAVPYIGTATNLFISLYSSASGPFAGLVLVAMSSPWVNAKGAAWGSLIVCLLQLWHAIGRRLSGFGLSPLIPGTLDRCPGNANDTINSSSINTPVHYVALVSSSDVFPLYRISFFWVSLLGALLTVLLATLLGLATGGAHKARRNLKLTSPVFLQLWFHAQFLRQALQLKNSKETDVHTLPKANYEDEDAIHAAQLLHCHEQHGRPKHDDNVNHECPA